MGDANTDGISIREQADGQEPSGSEDHPTDERARTSRKEQALAALLSYPTLKQAGEAAGVPERTLRRWLRTDPRFLRRFRAGRKEILDAVIGELRSNARPAVRVLRKIATGKDDPAHSRVAAARAVIDYTFKGTELLDVVERIEAVEEMLDRAEKPN